jgi:hypothetical protein
MLWNVEYDEDRCWQVARKPIDKLHQRLHTASGGPDDNNIVSMHRGLSNWPVGVDDKRTSVRCA